MENWHLTYSSESRHPLFPSEDRRRLALRTMGRVAGKRVAFFGLEDDHFHLNLLSDARQAGFTRRALTQALGPIATPASTPRRAAALAAALIALAAAGCTRAENAQAPNGQPVQATPEQTEPPGPVLASVDGVVHEAAAWIDAMPGVGAKRTLIVTALLETSCMNDKAELAGRGGFGVTGRTFLVEIEIQRQEICLTALGRLVKCQLELGKHRLSEESAAHVFERRSQEVNFLVQGLGIAIHVIQKNQLE